jgi:hypothetical protein
MTETTAQLFQRLRMMLASRERMLFDVDRSKTKTHIDRLNLELANLHGHTHVGNATDIIYLISKIDALGWRSAVRRRPKIFPETPDQAAEIIAQMEQVWQELSNRLRASIQTRASLATIQ